MTDPLRLPRLHKEEEAAEILDTSKATVRRERERGRIGYLRLGDRGVRYTDDHLAAYIEQRSVEPCDTESKDLSSSEATGSPSGRRVPLGAEPGSTERLDRHAAHRSAQMILKKQRNDS